ncbi:ISL3 family transposase, partial [Corynebacterium phoceense]|nr:ISL3 family transposase [Corynebacterium phoceense]
MDGFQGYATAAGEVIPNATQVMDPLYRNRKTLLTTERLLTDKQRGRLEELFDFDDDYAPLQETW